MARLTAPGVGSLGMGTPLARFALIMTVALYAINGVVVGYLDPGNPVGFVPYALMVIANLLLTVQSDRPLGPLGAGATIACAVLAGAIVLFTESGEFRPQLFVASLLALALLAVRGNVTAAWLGVGVFVVVGIGWAAAHEVPPVAVLARFAFLVGVPVGQLWRVQAVKIAQTERRYRSETSRAEFAVQVAREADRRTASELRLVRGEAEGVLTRLRDGLPVEEVVLVMTEASIRDRLRAPQLQTERLRRAVRDARRRGVRVLEMGQRTDLRPPISVTLAGAAAEILDRVAAGEVTIRLLPERRSAALSVLVETSSGSHLHLLGQDGRTVPHL